jgi:uncharacterized membrane protein YphA (DoxX/SURF4 family)
MLFSTFPGGGPGLGLLLLRAMVGCALVIQASAYFFSSHAGLDCWVPVMITVLCAAFLLLGLYTQIASLSVTVGVAGIALSWFPAPERNLFSQNMMTISILMTSLAIVLLGPGAFSLDARLFGRREIIIPHASKSTES